MASYKYIVYKYIYILYSYSLPGQNHTIYIICEAEAEIIDYIDFIVFLNCIINFIVSAFSFSTVLYSFIYYSYYCWTCSYYIDTYIIKYGST